MLAVEQEVIDRLVSQGRADCCSWRRVVELANVILPQVFVAYTVLDRCLNPVPDLASIVPWIIAAYNACVPVS